MDSNKKHTTRRPDGQIEARIRECINTYYTTTGFTRKAVWNVTRSVDRALGLGFSGGTARARLHSFVKRVLTERGAVIG